MPAARKTQTQRLIDNLVASYRRLDSGQLQGRNSASSDATRAFNWRRLQDALTAGGYEELDANPRLADRYYRLERRHLLGRDALEGRRL